MVVGKKIERFIPAVKYLWLTVVFLTIIWKGILPGWEKKSADFNNYYTAAKLVVEKEPIHQFYNNDWFQNKAYKMGIEEGAKFSPFTPITAYIFTPLTFWNPITAKRIWLVVNVILLITLFFRIKKITAWHSTQTMLFISLFTFPISSCLNFGQLYLFIGFLLLELFGQIYFRNKPKFIGIVIGILASLKYIPILFLGYAITHQKKFIILFTVLLAIIIPNLIIYWIEPQSYNAFYQHFQSHIQGHLPGQGKYAVGFQSIDSLLNNLFVSNVIENPKPFIDLPVLKPIFKFLLYGGVISLLFLALKKGKYKITQPFTSISMVGAFVLLPATASYHFLLLIWPLLCIFKWLYNSNSMKKIGILAIIVFVVFSLQVHHIPNINQFKTLNLLLHYPRLWGVICLFLLLNFYYFKQHSKNYG